MSDTATLPDSAEGLLVNRQHIPFELDAGIAERAAIGVIVLGSDQTVEYEFRRLLDLPGVAFYESRIHNAPTITPESLKEMEAGIADCTARILPGLSLDVVAYGCTSGAMVIGDDNVAARIHEARPGVATTTPMAAAFEINQTMRAHIEAGGYAVPAMGSFNEGNDNKVGRISLESVCNAALEIGRLDQVDMVFVSCTALRLVDGVAKLEAELGKPVTSSNHALAWHCLRMAGVEDALPQFGRLFTVSPT
jgi:maleate isomerase